MKPDVSARPPAVAVAILAAGASLRMGKPKLLLPWGGTSVLGHLLAQWRRLAVEQITVVCAAGDQAVPQELDRVGFRPEDRIVNPTPALGMFSSIRCAARWNGWRPGLTHWILALGDQPQLRPATLRALLTFGAAHPQQICQPARNGRPRHPVWMPGAVFRQLAAAPATDLKEFLRNRSTQLAICPVADPGLDFDLDTPADYEQARRQFLEP
jgi:molybdenum cofactor cytidylyltransferase